MQSLKFEPGIVQDILDEKYTTTWRLHDSKNIALGDKVALINSANGSQFATAVIDSITYKYLGNIDTYDMQFHQSYDSPKHMYEVFKKYYGNSVSASSEVKIYRFRIFKDNVNDVAKTTKLTEVKLYTDGGSRGNPGPSALGYVIKDANEVTIDSGAKYLGITTNNQAEYQAVKMGLEECAKHTQGIVNVFLDSQLVANQMNGIYKIKNRELWPIHQSIKEIAEHNFNKVSFTYIPRELNKDADAMVNQALDDNAKS